MSDYSGHPKDNEVYWDPPKWPRYDSVQTITRAEWEWIFGEEEEDDVW